jgi:hypothetical protein
LPWQVWSWQCKNKGRPCSERGWICSKSTISKATRRGHCCTDQISPDHTERASILKPSLIGTQKPITKMTSGACDAQMELKCTIHAAIERLLNGSRVGVNIATGPRDVTDLNAIEEHWAKPIICHPDKGHRENTAIGQGKTNGREIRHHEWFATMWTKNTCICFYVFLSVFYFFRTDLDVR